MKPSRLIPLTCVLLTLALGARRARAAEGPYVGIDAGVSEPTNDNYRSEVKLGGTGAPFAGVMFNEYVGIQAQVHVFFHSPNPNNDLPQPNLDDRYKWTTILGLAAGPRFSLPLTKKVDLYAVGEGGGFKGLGGRLNQWAPGFTVGGGVEFKVTPKFAIGLFGRWNRVYMAPHPTFLVGQGSDDQGPSDAQFATAGLSLAYFYGPQPVSAPPPPPPSPPPTQQTW